MLFDGVFQSLNVLTRERFKYRKGLYLKRRLGGDDRLSTEGYFWKILLRDACWGWNVLVVLMIPLLHQYSETIIYFMLYMIK